MIVRLLPMGDIKEKYPGKEVNEKRRWGVREEFDYVVISIEIWGKGPQKDDPEFLRYWIIDDSSLSPYDAYNFTIIDGSIPSQWTSFLTDGGMGFSHPKWADAEYYNDYFDEIDVEIDYNKIIKKI